MFFLKHLFRFSYFTLFLTRVMALVFCLSLMAMPHSAKAQAARLDSLKEADDDDDESSVQSCIDILNRFYWQVTITGKNGETRQFETKRPDTMLLNNVSLVKMATAFAVSPRLTGHTSALEYSVNGDLEVKANGEDILRTGVFNKTKNTGLSQTELKGFENLTFKDTTSSLEINYIPNPRIKILNLKLKLADLANTEKEQERRMAQKAYFYSIGYYFLAFSIVFMLFFLFLRQKTENLYFALFCLCAALYCICKTSSVYLYNILALFFFVYSFDFISFFFAKVLRNKNRSRISLFVRLTLTALCFHPAILYDLTFFGLPLHNNVTIGNSTGMSAPIILILVFVVLFLISFISSVVNLIRGFRQKRWEARTIVYVVILALFLSFLLPTGSAVTIPWLHRFLVMLSGMGIYLYPIGAAIVLSRTNGLNQKKLLDQLVSIKNLSEENLAREKEKKQLLENQNTELERKVDERTQEVLRQKEIIEIKNKSITDNLIYAQRIQSAILPDIRLIYKALEQSFILYLPKDIVSGDFYAFAERNGRVLIIAADCTGHGVSGAFMSMIGSSLLNQIINERGIDRPDLILNVLNTLIIDTFRQTENESSAAADGMDISICSFDLRTLELQYAGANRPLWLIRNNDFILIKPDKFPIGGMQAAKDRQFTNHTLQLQQNDTLYIFTDGYADQFGGEKGKKLMSAKFREMLQSIQSMPMPEQESYLRHHFEKWKGAHEQVDDVLVIGVRV